MRHQALYDRKRELQGLPLQLGEFCRRHKVVRLSTCLNHSELMHQREMDIELVSLTRVSVQVHRYVLFIGQQSESGQRVGFTNPMAQRHDAGKFYEGGKRPGLKIQQFDLCVVFLHHRVGIEGYRWLVQQEIFDKVLQELRIPTSSLEDICPEILRERSA